MDREAEAQEQVTSINDAAKAIGVENQMMSRTGDDELADYNSDQDIGMKTEYGSRSQSIGIFSYPPSDILHQCLRLIFQKNGEPSKSHIN